MPHPRRKLDRERGQILVLFELALIVILGFAAIVIDLGVLRNNRQILVNTFDSAALAGGHLLPVDGSVAGNAAAVNTLINKTIQANYPGGLPTSNYTITYKCLIGADATTGAPLVSRDVPTVCNPTNALGHTPVASDFSSAGLTGVWITYCDPTLGDKCNVVVITGSATTQYLLAPVLGVGSGSTGIVVSAACNGPCGTSPVVPVDLVIILDRTLSMAGSSGGANKITSLQNAAKAVLSVYNPAKQRVALGVVGPSAVDASGNPVLGGCDAGGSATVYGAADNTSWVPETTLNSATTTLNSATTTLSSATTTLSSAITTTTATTIHVASATGFPTSGTFYIQIDSEQMQVTGGQGTTTWTVVRGRNGTTAATHANGASVAFVVGTADTTITVASKTGFPTTYPFYIQIDSEQLQVTASPGSTTWTVVRGRNGTTATTHINGRTVAYVVGTADTTITVASKGGFPITYPFSILVDSEQMQVTASPGSSTWTVVRARSGTTAATHTNGAAVALVVGTADTTIKVAAANEFPTSGTFNILINSEQMLVTGGQGTTTWTVSRAQNGTSAATHTSGATVFGADGWTASDGTPINNGVGAKSWVPVGLSGTDTNSVWSLPNPNGTAGTYEVGGVPSTSSYIVPAINCIAAASDGTNLATPIAMAQWYLDHYGRKGVTQGIILETDGHPQYGFGGSTYDQWHTNASFTCQAAAAAAAAAKADTTNTASDPSIPQGIQIFTIGYGVDSTVKCPVKTSNMSANNGTNNVYESPTWSGANATTLLSTMATDASHYYENPTSSQLEHDFTEAAQKLSKGGSHIIQPCLAPIVTNLNPATWTAKTGGTAITITGQYFTGASKVTFGGTPATSFSVSNDTSITATTTGATAGVTVTTPCGTN
ncbi:MAG: pilus assembly protein TadG-related protein [Candidatus Limnocylindrales bacterium]|jgi:hypothetical protein